MEILPIYQCNFCGIQNSTNLTLNRKLLKPVRQNLSVLAGPSEKSEAKGWVAAYTASNTLIAAAMAQAPGADEAVLSGVEVAMATHIFNVIYDFKFSKTALKSLAVGIAGHTIGKTAFKVASKTLTWIPGLGNALNATIAGSTTAMLGAALISYAEEMDDARRRGKKLDEFLKKLGG